ncbi:MAG: PEGA domain-containing protein [Methanomicrobiales archaeon]|nr:PEGA domain-containing protein [Methanomicrobiales archaeon]
MVKEIRASYLSLFLIVALVCITPVAAGSIAIYGSTTGFRPELHADRFSVAYSFPGQSGQLFDQNVSKVTDPSIQVLFIGSDDTFSASTADAIEAAVWEGKMLVISYPSTGKFGDSLPFSAMGTTMSGDYLEIANPNNGISQAVFAGLPDRFNATEPVPQRLVGKAKPGTVTVLKYDNGDPALAYRKYGNGYVIGWTLATPSVYLGGDGADTVMFRLVTALLESQQVVPTITATPPPEVTTPAGPGPRPTGNVTINSNPLGATVFLDGVYKGVTPLELSGIPTGYHSVKMTIEGRYDYDGSVFVVSGETVSAFGSLPRQESHDTMAATPVPTPAAPATSGSDSPLNSPTVVAGAITAGIGAVVTIYTHMKK